MPEGIDGGINMEFIPKTLDDHIEEQKANRDIMYTITKPWTPAELQEIAEQEGWI